MSERLTTFYDKYKMKKNNNKKKINYMLSFIIFIIVVLILIVVVYPKNKSEWAEEKEIYFIVSETNIPNSKITKVCSDVENYGGSGVLVDFDEYKNCAIIFAYFNENDAQKILDSSKALFQNATIVSKKISYLTKNIQIKIKNSDLLEPLMFLHDEKYNSHNILLKFEKGEISFNELYEYAYKLKIEISHIISKFSSDELNLRFKNSYENLLSLIDRFLKDNLKSEYNSLYFKKFVVNLILEEIALKSDIL